MDHIDRRIKSVAQTTMIAIIIGAIGLAISDFILFIASDMDMPSYIFTGIMKIIVGSMIAYATYVLIYGFGELVGRSISIDEALAEHVASANQPAVAEASATQTTSAEKTEVAPKQKNDILPQSNESSEKIPSGWWKCSNCGRGNPPYVTKCGCGTGKNEQ